MGSAHLRSFMELAEKRTENVMFTAICDVAVPRLEKAIKGGGSNSYPSWVRAAARKGYEPDFRYFCLGFRCAMDASAVGNRVRTD